MIFEVVQAPSQGAPHGPRPALTAVLIGALAMSACAPGPADPPRVPAQASPQPALPRDRPSLRSATARGVRDCAGCPRMVVIPAGAFVIGSGADEPKRKKNEGPQREVTIATFAVSEFETTRAQYAAFVDETNRATPVGCLTAGETMDGQYHDDARASWRDPGYAQSPDHPVVCVAWADARDYAAWLSRKTGHTYRLLSDSEWEYAARAGTTSAYFWGDDRELGCAYANGCDQSLKRIAPPAFGGIFASCDDGAAFTTPVGRYKPNAFGLFDMTGNAWEWVLDCTEASYDSLPSNGLPRDREGCTERDVRGGSWDDDPEDLRNASRHHTEAARRSYDLGFRVARAWPSG